MRWIHALASMVLFASVSGCSFSDNDPHPIDPVAPGPGEELPADAFTKLEGSEQTSVAEGSVWLVPFWVDTQVAELTASSDRIRYLDIKAGNLGLLTIPILPFYVEVDQASFDRSGVRSSSGFAWTPFYAWSKDTQGSDIVLRASGIPLLWGSVDIVSHSDTLDVRIRHFLWSLGPTYFGLKKGIGDSVIEGYEFLPLLAGGFGSWLWSSTDLRSDFGTVTAHGFLNGSVGYYASEGFSPSDALEIEDAISMADDGKDIGGLFDSAAKTEAMKRTNAEGLVERTKLLLGGILWAAWTDSDPNGAEVNGRHGPLWSMFGYGTKQNEPTIILFWYPF